MKQRSIQREARLSGVGLHTGNQCNLLFRPAPAGTGIVFVRVDLDGRPRIPADAAHVVGLDRGTSLGIDGAKVHTVEHVLAAVTALSIDHLLIELDANEPPVEDGSALPFFVSLKEAGIVTYTEEREVFSLQRPFHHHDGNVQFTLVPSDRLQITFSIDFDHPLVGHQYASFEITPEVFERELAPARTFGFLHEVEQLKEAGLIRGGSLDNAIVIGDDEILNPERLRFPNEFVRHKILDLIGDLSLLGREIRAHVISNRSGHKTNVDLVNALLEVADPAGRTERSAARVGAGKGAGADGSGRAAPQGKTAVGRGDGGDAAQVKTSSAGNGGDGRGEAARQAEAPAQPLGGGEGGGRPAGVTVGERQAPFGVTDILDLIPHRFPFLLVDRVIELEPWRRIVGIKNVTINEPFFTGHFPGQPIMPGVLIVEAMGQVGGLLLLNSVEDPQKKLVYFVALDGVKFRRPVIPGDQLRIETELLKLRGRTCRMRGVAYVDDARVAEAVMTAVLVDRTSPAPTP